MRIVCFTSFALNYLPRARVLAGTLRRAHPDWPLWAVLVDQPPPGFDFGTALDAFAGVIGAASLGIPRFRAWLFRHDLVEACTALKGAMLCHLLARGADAVVYFDPDIAILHPLDSLPVRLRRDSVLLTPHQVAPSGSPAAFADNEAASLRYGIFNLGFLAVRNDATGRDFAAWWAARLEQACFDAPERGLFTDQKYCDLAPALFERIGIVRDPGWNVASWNLARRPLAMTPEGGITAGGAPLAFYHFSKHGGAGDAMTARYAGETSLPHELWRWYGRQLEAHARPATPAGWWHFAQFSDGRPIPARARRLYREQPELMLRFPDPFDARTGGYRDWFAAQEAAPA